MMKKKSKTWLPFLGLGFGSLFGSLIQKAMSTTIVEGLPGNPPHYFHKPWFQTLYMFFAMFLSIIVYLIVQWKKNGRIKISVSFKNFCFFAIPALCDLCMTVLHLASFLYLGVSISLVVGFCRVIFSALIAKFVLKQVIMTHQIFAICMIICSLLFVAVAIIKGTGSPPIKASPTARFIAIAAKLLAQIIDASKSAIEQHITHQMKVDSTFLVGAEGFWGLLATVFIFIPIVTHSKPGTVVGFSENFADTFAMLSNSSFLRIIVFIDVFYILFLNIFHMLAVENTSALFATLFDSIQGAIVWASQVIIYYSLQNTKYDSYKTLGEQWTKWSFLQMFGFLISIFAMLIYNGLIKLPCFKSNPKYYVRIPSAAASSDSADVIMFDM
ncbi:Integral membrane protein [Tritrichomonas foetus]|uniref:Integral membrane protein n=1 Tax=Tritrichomonas foetus TaxID=1144522 RepID=A0A1J4K9H0_9EUKA|nr:Integral membrane protein [Tritrichomonas foetus]|eukprot:OHT06093.1 Integral membrane protein [Tritrichomonas foetus]